MSTDDTPAQRSFTVAAAQIRSTDDREDNLRQVRGAAQEAARQGAALVVFPEATSSWFGSSVRAAAEDLDDGATPTLLRRLAGELGITIAAGFFTPAGGGRVHNTVLLTGPAGEAVYRKVHLFDAFGSKESDTVAPGEEYVVAPVADGRGGTVQVGLATCYDVRFADQFTALGLRGAEVIALPTSWGAGPGKLEQWQTLTRARALDSQSWLVAAGQAHQEAKGAAPLGIGHSAVIDPLGNPVDELGSEPGLLGRTIDLGQVEAVRSRIPVLSAQR
ncbi:carbon-nitrogen hydrolase family protein [Marihabitans asiaticum]|uniref:Putative amidohydrolase n=1 Tax=Marihabitans asiaticum TaxID=415218 RepID=A0A560WA41_9MICO|nr:carbon-nitrogen hydrolase family protein [Marihabitans asiaticum]TWD14494.1 putative amidohydrolase [Marihabitans asiaticum]